MQACSASQRCSLHTPFTTTFACRSPIIADARPTSPTAADILLNPTTTGGPVSSYEVKLCPNAPATGPCATITCPTVECPVSRLIPGTDYTVSAVAVVGGNRVPASNTLQLAMPDSNTPTLTSVVDTSSTTGAATAAAPPGATYTQVRETRSFGLHKGQNYGARER